MKYYLSFFTAIILFILFVQLSTTKAENLSASFYVNALEAKVGDTLSFKLKINPKTGRPVYTVSATLMYDPEALEYIDSEFVGEKWFEITSTPHSLFDTKNGMLRRTAGHPTGIDSSVDFLTFQFKVLKAGSTTVSITDGLALDASNIDLGLQNKQINLNISDLGDFITDYEFQDLSIELDISGKVAIYKEDDYIFKIQLQPQDLEAQAITKIWAIKDSGEIVFEDEIQYMANLSDVEITIPANTLDVGEYSLIASTRYEDGREIANAEKNIGVLSNGQTWLSKNQQFFFIIFSIVTLIAVLHHLARDTEMYRKLNALNNKLRNGKKPRRK